MCCHADRSATFAMRLARSHLRLSVVAVACVFAVRTAEARIPLKDICHVKGQEENTLQGLGLVVGLKGTGDSPGSAPSIRSLAQAIQLWARRRQARPARFERRHQERRPGAGHCHGSRRRRPAGRQARLHGQLDRRSEKPGRRAVVHHGPARPAGRQRPGLRLRPGRDSSRRSEDADQRQSVQRLPHGSGFFQSVHQGRQDHAGAGKEPCRFSARPGCRRADQQPIGLSNAHAAKWPGR